MTSLHSLHYSTLNRKLRPYKWGATGQIRVYLSMKPLFHFITVLFSSVYLLNPRSRVSHCHRVSDGICSQGGERGEVLLLRALPR